MSKQLLFVIIPIITLIMGISVSGLHPVTGSGGYTGGPGNGICTQCHAQSSTLDGNITISGLPSTIIAGETYSLTVVINNPNGLATRAGFQLVAQNQANQGFGTFGLAPSFTTLRTVGSRVYWGHSPAENFNGSTSLTYEIEWTAPATIPNNTEARFYASALIANGNGSTSGDRTVSTSVLLPTGTNNPPIEIVFNDSFNSCFGDSNATLTATVTGGDGNYTYLWNTGGTTNTINNLPNGVYSITVTDGTGTTASGETEVTSPPQITSDITTVPSCVNDSNGSASIISQGGVGNFSYQWSNGQVGNLATGLLPNTLYTVTVTDGNGCTVVEEAEILALLNPVAEPIIIDTRCGGMNGSINANVLSGSPPFTYAWSNGANSPVISNLMSGLYSVTIQDVNGCSHIDNDLVVQESSPVSIPTVSIVEPTCFGYNNGSISFSPTGEAPFTFSWSDGTQQSGTLTSLIQLGGGSYTVTVTDFFDCQLIQTFFLDQPDPLNYQIQTDQITCYNSNDGCITIITNETFSYLWSNGDTSNVNCNLTPGNYSVTISDNQGCDAINQITIQNPDTLIVTLGQIQAASCFGAADGIASSIVTGGTMPYNYLWSNGGTGTNNDSLIGGQQFVLSVTDFRGCTGEVTGFIESPAQLSISFPNVTQPTCDGALNGSITAVVSNGVSPYTFLWSNGSISQTIDNVMNGVYSITVTDDTGCSRDTVFSLSSLSSFSINLDSVTNNLCYGDSLGAIALENIPNFTYNWSNNFTGHFQNNLASGEYTIIGVDNQNCSSIPLTVTVTSPPQIVANIISVDTLLCKGENFGFIHIELEGGSGNLAYNWSNGINALLLDTVEVGNYVLNVIDENQCSANFAYAVIEVDSISIGVDTIANISCFGQVDGQILLSLSGGFGELIIEWKDTTLLGDTLIFLPSGSYPLSVMDAAGCIAVDTFYIIEPLPLNANTLVTDETVIGAEDGTISVTPNGGTAPFSIVWNDGNTSFERSNLKSGIYRFQITDASECTYSNWAVVGGGSCSFSIDVTTAPSNCINSFDGAIIIKINGPDIEYVTNVYQNGFVIPPPYDALMAGRYFVIVNDNNGCLAINRDVVIDFVNPPVILNDFEIVNTTLGQSTGAITITTSGGSGNLTYQWLLENEVIATVPNPQELSAGNYTLVIVDDEGCTYKFEDFLVEVASNNSEIFNTEVKVMPNPIYNEFSIISEYNEPIYLVELIDNHGRTHFRDIVDNYEYTKNISQFAPGAYLLKIITLRNTYFRQVIIVK